MGGRHSAAVDGAVCIRALRREAVEVVGPGWGGRGGRALGADTAVTTETMGSARRNRGRGRYGRQKDESLGCLCLHIARGGRGDGDRGGHGVDFGLVERWAWCGLSVNEDGLRGFGGKVPRQRTHTAERRGQMLTGRMEGYLGLYALLRVEGRGTKKDGS